MFKGKIRYEDYDAAQQVFGVVSHSNDGVAESSLLRSSKSALGVASDSNGVVDHRDLYQLRRRRRGGLALGRGGGRLGRVDGGDRPALLARAIVFGVELDVLVGRTWRSHPGNAGRARCGNRP